MDRGWEGGKKRVFNLSLLHSRQKCSCVPFLGSSLREEKGFSGSAQDKTATPARRPFPVPRRRPHKGVPQNKKGREKKKPHRSYFTSRRGGGVLPFSTRRTRRGRGGGERGSSSSSKEPEQNRDDSQYSRSTQRSHLVSRGEKGPNLSPTPAERGPNNATASPATSCLPEKGEGREKVLSPTKRNRPLSRV